MPRRVKIPRDTMLREFGYDVERMTDDAKSAAADRMEKTHKLTHFYIPPKKMRHYYLDEVEKASRPIAA